MCAEMPATQLANAYHAQSSNKFPGARIGPAHQHPGMPARATEALPNSIILAGPMPRKSTIGNRPVKLEPLPIPYRTIHCIGSRTQRSGHRFQSFCLSPGPNSKPKVFNASLANLLTRTQVSSPKASAHQS